MCSKQTHGKISNFPVTIFKASHYLPNNDPIFSGPKAQLRPFNSCMEQLPFDYGSYLQEDQSEICISCKKYLHTPFLIAKSKVSSNSLSKRENVSDRFWFYMYVVHEAHWNPDPGFRSYSSLISTAIFRESLTLPDRCGNLINRMLIPLPLN